MSEFQGDFEFDEDFQMWQDHENDRCDESCPYCAEIMRELAQQKAVVNGGLKKNNLFSIIEHIIEFMFRPDSEKYRQVIYRGAKTRVKLLHPIEKEGWTLVEIVEGAHDGTVLLMSPNKIMDWVK